jgi:hypothetical protein
MGVVIEIFTKYPRPLESRGLMHCMCCNGHYPTGATNTNTTHKQVPVRV